MRSTDAAGLSSLHRRYDGPVPAALREAARDARRLHKALGHPMATWKDGQVVWIQPEDIIVDDDSEPEPNRTD